MAVKLLIIAAVCIATVHGAPHGASVSVPIQTVAVPSTAIVRTNFHAQDEQGQYAYGYSSEDGQYKKEVKTLDGTVRGLYGYNSPDGRHVLVRYRADDNGFVSESDFVEEPGVSGVSRPVVTLSEQVSVPASRESTGFIVQEELDDSNSGVQVDQDAYTNRGYSAYTQDGYYTQTRSPYQPAAAYVSSNAANQKYYATESPLLANAGSLSEYDSKHSDYSGGVSSYSTVSSTPSYYTYVPSASVGSKSSSHKYYFSQDPQMTPVQNLYSGSQSQYADYDSTSSGYSGGVSGHSTYTSSPTYYTYVPASSAASGSSGHKYYYSRTPVDSEAAKYTGYGTRESPRPVYDNLRYPSQTSVVYIPQPEQRVYYPKESSYIYRTEKPSYEYRPIQTVDDHYSYNPKSRVAVSVSHHGTPFVAVAHAPVVSVTPVPTVYSPSPAVKVHVPSAPAVSAHAASSSGYFHSTPSPVQVNTVSLSPIHVKVHKPAVQSSYVISSTPAPVQVVSPSILKRKLVSAANPLKLHYVSPSVSVKSPSVKIQPAYYSLPVSYPNTIASYASAGTSPYKLFPFASYASAGTSPYASYSYLPATSLYGAYQPSYYYIQSPMAAVQSSLQKSYVPSLSYNSWAYNNPVKTGW